MDSNKVKTISHALANNSRTIIAVISFFIAMYVQNEIHDVKIEKLQDEMVALSNKQDEAYQKIDEIKLDKAVFAATMTQIQPIRDDLRELRTDIKEILKSINHSK